MAKYGYIYLITNTSNNKMYVGQTIRSVSKRFEEHCKADSYIGSAIRKYGKDKFTLNIIDYATNEQELNEKEINWIDELGTFGIFGYNLTTGGDGKTKNKKIPINLNKGQVHFLEQIQEQRKPDINNPNEMISMIALTLMELYLLSKFEMDKKNSAKLICRLKPKMLSQVLKFGVIDKKELIHWGTIK